MTVRRTTKKGTAKTASVKKKACSSCRVGNGKKTLGHVRRARGTGPRGK